MALAYLLSPTFQVENSAGKPATGGWIETFVSGSRDPYYCYSDFQGTLHPFRIPLDSLGSNVVLADDGQAYDVYVYNRYGGLLMSRYNVKPGHGAGGGGGTITSSDGSIDVTMTPTGYDLKVNGQEASVLRAGANDLTSDGQFVFYELVRDGDHVTVDSNGKIRLEDGWYHYDVTARVKWEDGVSVVNTENHVQLYTTLNSDIIPFDCSYEHEDTLHLHGQVKIATSGSQFVVGVQGIEQGMSIELVDCGLFAITGHGDAAEYEAGTGIIIDDHEISVDPSVVQEKLTAGTGIIIDDNEVSVDTTAIQEKLEAGDNIVIEGNVISATAAPQEQSDWAETDTADVSYIKNKPGLKPVVAGNNITITEGNDSFTISATADPQVQADWSETDTSDPSYIQNKPDLSVYATDAELTSGLATKQDVISDLATIRSGAAAGATAVQPSDLATVATTGDYSDLSGTPSIPTATSDLTNDSGFITLSDVPAQVNADWDSNSGASEILNKPDLSIYAETANLATVATTGSYDDLADKPTIPAAQVNSDWNSNSGVSQILNKPILSTVATTGDYDDLVNKPSIPAAQVNADWNSSSGVSEILNKPTLAAVATSGDYADLSGTPTINNVPAVTSSDDNKVLKASYTGGVGSYSWETETGTTYSAGTGIDITSNTISVENPLPASTSAEAGKYLKVDSNGDPTWATGGGGGGGVNADWTEDDPLEPSYIENKPTPKTLTAGANISISEGVGTLTISAAAGLPASTSADEGKCLVVDSNGDPEWGTGGKTYTGTDGVVVDNVNDTVGLEAPVDIVAGPGIAIDNPDGNTLRVSANADSFFKELYYNATNTNDTAGKVYALSEPITNFMYAKITVDNMEFANRPLVYEIDVQHNTTTCVWNSPLDNGNVDNTINLPVCQLQINASGNLVLVARALTYNTYPSPNFTNGDNRGMRVVRVVGIFRIAGGN